MKADLYREVVRALRALVDAQVRTERAAEARAALPAGSRRARVTTANARWAIRAEARDRVLAEAVAALRAAGLPPPVPCARCERRDELDPIPG